MAAKLTLVYICPYREWSCSKCARHCHYLTLETREVSGTVAGLWTGAAAMGRC